MSAALLARRYRALTLGMVALVALCAFESLAVATAMPSVAAALHGTSLYALCFAATLAASVIGFVLAGQWSDSRGPALPLWIGTGGFIIGLLMAGLAPNMRWLLAGRSVQGLGVGLIGVALHVVVAATFPVVLRPRVFAAFSAAWVVPTLVGPLLAGLIVEHIGWRWVFLSVPPLAVPAIIVLRSGLGNFGPPERSPAPASAGTTHQMAWALIAATSAGLLHIAAQLPGLRGIALGALALIALASAMARLLPSGALLAQRGLPSVIALRALASAAFFGTEIFIPLLLSREYGLAPLWAGGVLMIGSLGWSCGSWYQGYTRRAWSRTQVLRVGFGLIALGILLLSAATAWSMPSSLGWTSRAAALIGWTVSGLGMGLVSPSLSVLTLALAPISEQGRNSSALQLADALATASVLAVAAWLFTLLLQVTASAAYLATFGMTGTLALLGLVLASRTQVSELDERIAKVAF